MHVYIYIDSYMYVFLCMYMFVYVFAYVYVVVFVPLYFMFMHVYMYMYELASACFAIRLVQMQAVFNPVLMMECVPKSVLLDRQLREALTSLNGFQSDFPITHICPAHLVAALPNCAPPQFEL